MVASTSAHAVTFAFDTGDGNGTGNQFVDTADQFALSLVGTNVPFADSVEDLTKFTATSAVAITYDISWSYFSFDRDSAEFDLFGYFINGNQVQLSDNSGPAFQNGNFALNLLAGDVFGFFIDSTDDVVGPGFASINGVALTSVPLPASGGLLIAALGGMALRRRSKIAA